LFTQERVATSAGCFLDGLLGVERRKTDWMRADAAGDPGPWRQQAILAGGRWDADALRDIVRECARWRPWTIRTPCWFDEGGFLKQGNASFISAKIEAMDGRALADHISHLLEGRWLPAASNRSWADRNFGVAARRRTTWQCASSSPNIKRSWSFRFPAVHMDASSESMQSIESQTTSGYSTFCRRRSQRHLRSVQGCRRNAMIVWEV